MILRHPFSWSSWTLFLALSAAALADDDSFDCSATVDNAKFDFKVLSGEHTVSRTRDTPPTSMKDELRFDLCSDLQVKSDVPDTDQCGSGTRACLTTINQKSDEGNRVVSVIPIAQISVLEPSFSLTTPKGVSIILHGPEYPHPSNSQPTAQSLQITILCASEQGDPKFIAYDNAQLSVEWESPAGCAATDDDSGGDGGNGGDGDGGKESRGSGIGWFFLVLLLAILAYFGLGAYYNYSNYGASGMDLIPHRDFWREVPYMLKDVVSHLCSAVRPRRASRGGYIAV